MAADASLEQGATVQVPGFEDFVASVRPVASSNRLPQIPGVGDVVTYQVFLNGAAASKIPAEYQDQRFDDAALHPLTERLGLDSLSFRDNAKVAELVALRSAWMNTVIRALPQRGIDPVGVVLPDEVAAEYSQLASGFDHPWIKAQLDAHRLRQHRIAPVLADAAIAHGAPVTDRAPETVSAGVILATNEAFTVQATGKGDVVTHDNAQLSRVPAKGDVVTISYYRGQGQVFANTKDLTFSEPYLDDKYNDLAIMVSNAQTGKSEVLLFQGVSAFAHFANAQGLETAVVEKALDVARLKMEKAKEKPVRIPQLPMHLDEATGAIALNFVEHGAVYTALFDSARKVQDLAEQYGIDPKDTRTFDHAKMIETVAAAAPTRQEALIAVSRKTAEAMLEVDFAGQFDVLKDADTDKGRYAGRVIGDTRLHVIQDHGRGTAMLHLKTELDRIPNVGTNHQIIYQGGRGQVTTKTQSQGHGR